MRGKTWAVVGLGAFLAAGWSAAQDVDDGAWDLGVSAGDSAGDTTRADEADPARDAPRPPMPALDLPLDAGPAEVLATLRERCGSPSLAEALEAAMAVAELETCAVRVVLKPPDVAVVRFVDQVRVRELPDLA